MRTKKETRSEGTLRQIEKKKVGKLVRLGGKKKLRGDRGPAQSGRVGGPAVSRFASGAI